MLHLENQSYLWLLLCIPVLVALFIGVNIQIKKQRKAFGDLLGLERLAPNMSTQKRPLKFSLIMIALLFLIIAFANPRMGNKTEKVKRAGIDVFVALDISRSMWATDLKPNRMEKARQFALKLIRSLRGDRIGLVFFAGQSYLQTPLTTDYSAAEMFVRTADPSIDITQGTSIGSAIDLVSELSRKEKKKKQRAIIVITDGENHEEAAISAATAAADKGIYTFMVGAGTAKGSPIPVIRNGRQQFKIDKAGQIVQSKMNKELLQQIAKAGNGVVLDINNPDLAIAQLKSKLSKLEKSEFEQQSFDVYESYYQYFVALAILLLIIEFMLGYRKNKWIK